MSKIAYWISIQLQNLLFVVNSWVVKLQADEYDGCFLGVSPSLAVVTNVEWEHVDMFPDEVLIFPRASVIPVVINCSESSISKRCSQNAETVKFCTFHLTSCSIQCSMRTELCVAGGSQGCFQEICHANQTRRISCNLW